MAQHRHLMLTIFLLLLLPLVIPAVKGAEGPRETALVWGVVYDVTTGKGLYNHTVTITAERFMGKRAMTDSEGRYSFNLTSGTFVARVFDPIGDQVDEYEFVLEEGQSRYLDFAIDPGFDPVTSIHGRITDRFDVGLRGCTVKLIKVTSGREYSTTTDRRGNYSLEARPGQYLFQVIYKGQMKENRTVEMGWNQARELSMKLDVKPKLVLPTMADVGTFLQDNWVRIILFLASILLLLVLYVMIERVGNWVMKRGKGTAFQEFHLPFRRMVQRIFLLIVLLILIYEISGFSKFVREYIWSWLPDFAVPLGGVFVVLFISRLEFHFIERFWTSVRTKKGKEGLPLVPGQLISLLEPVTRFVAIGLSALLILVLVLTSLGLIGQIIGTLTSFFIKNAGKLVFLVLIVALAFFLKKFVDILFKELTQKRTKMNVQMLDLSRKGTMGITYFAIGLITVFTLFSIFGLGDIGQTFILVISMIVGLVFSFAATGSIGNILSGLVLMTMRPFEVNDRVQVGNFIGDVQSIGIMFTRIKDLEGRITEVPNNNVLQNNIVNFTTSGKEGGFAVFVDVTLGYDIHPKKARSLLKKAALATPGVLKDPVPKVLLREFQNHAVEYRLRAYISDPSNMSFVRSGVMENMMNMFHGEGLEILSPIYEIQRQGRNIEATMPHLSRVYGPEDGCVVSDGLSMFDPINSEYTKDRSDQRQETLDGPSPKSP